MLFSTIASGLRNRMYVVMRSLEGGQIWENIAAALNSLQQSKFRVTASQELFEIGIHF